MVKVRGGLFEVGKVTLSPGANQQAAYLQLKKGRKGEEALMVHCSVLLKLHTTGEHGNLPASDRRLNRNNIEKNAGRVLSVIGEKYIFVIITELPDGATLITTPQEV